jgi:glycosyltransferase involved in cell wall biosynthesis
MNSPNFSVLTPVYIHSPQRKLGLIRAIHSVGTQTHDDFEHIVIDDGSPVVFEELEKLQVLYPNLVYQRNEAHLERINCYHDAFTLARGEWFVFLDSDDMLSPYALELYKKVINENPDYKMFNFGCMFICKDGRVVHRGPFAPAKLEVGHEIFGKGQIVNGTFIFHRSVYEELGGFPHGVITPEDQDEMERLFHRRGDLEMTNPWGFSCYAQMEFPELQQFCFVDMEKEPLKYIAELGNPMGNDFYLFFKYTRKFQSLPLDLYLYWVFPK